MTSLSVQQMKEIIVNQIKLPIVIIDVIKSFAFYETKTAIIIKEVKKYKVKLCKTISLADCKHTAEPDYLHYPCEWWFVYSIHNINNHRETTRVQGINCMKCGGYLNNDLYSQATENSFSYSLRFGENVNYPDIIRCKCVLYLDDDYDYYYYY